MTTDLHVLCLCCGEIYPPDRDCQNVERLPHSTELAFHVSNLLLSKGIAQPSSEQVREALDRVVE